MQRADSRHLRGAKGSMKSRRWFVVIVVLVVGSGAVSGRLFGERSIPESEERQVMRASRIVANLMDWLPEEVPPSDIVYDGIGSMLETLDPHSSFLDPRTFERMRARQEGSFFGVGIIISRRDGKVTVIAPIAGTPAAAKGLRAGDVITAVGDESSDQMNLDDVVDRVRGPEGSTVDPDHRPPRPARTRSRSRSPAPASRPPRSGSRS